jgi:hypothetical protein
MSDIKDKIIITELESIEKDLNDFYLQIEKLFNVHGTKKYDDESLKFINFNVEQYKSRLIDYKVTARDVSPAKQAYYKEKQETHKNKIGGFLREIKLIGGSIKSVSATSVFSENPSEKENTVKNAFENAERGERDYQGDRGEMDVPDTVIRINEEGHFDSVSISSTSSTTSTTSASSTSSTTSASFDKSYEKTNNKISKYGCVNKLCLCCICSVIMISIAVILLYVFKSKY